MQITDDQWTYYSWDLEKVVEETPTNQSRWTTSWEMVVFDPKENQHYLLEWDEGSTEYQETEPNRTVTKVYPQEAVHTIYVKRED